MVKTVDVYLLDAEKLEPVAAQCLPLLTPSRRIEAERYQERSARLRAIATGLLLYKILGVQDDAALVFNAYGKPSLTEGGPQFSLSHAGRYAALAVAPFPVGVDIEPVQADYPQILCRYFRSDELNWLHQSPCRERFYTLWTRLESALKAAGTGFACKKRHFSLLDDSPLFFVNTVYDGHMLACAASECFIFRKMNITVDSLFPQS